MSEVNAKDERAAPYCPVKGTLSLLQAKWTLHIVQELLAGSKRFNELAAALGGVNPRTLCARLRALEEKEVVERRVVSTIPPWVEYRLTEKGRALSAVIDTMACWGRRWMAEPEEPAAPPAPSSRR